MAIYPCAFGMHRYSQAQQTIYLTVIRGSTPASVKLRLCPQHFRDLREAIRDEMDDVSLGGQASIHCQRCDGPRTIGAFARVFPQQAEEETYALDLCDDCVGGWQDHMQISRGEHLSGR